MFYEDSYGYRPNKLAIQAIEKTRVRCWKRDWVLEFDIKGPFDNIRHDYLIGKKAHSREMDDLIREKMVKNVFPERR